MKGGGEINTGDEYLNAFFDLYLRTLVCSKQNKQEINLIDENAQRLIKIDNEKFCHINPLTILRLCEKFLELDLPLNAVDYLQPFLDDKSWVSPIFECYLTALLISEKFNLFLDKIVHLEAEDKTYLICIREAEVYNRLAKYDLSIQAVQAAIKISPTEPYAWILLLYVSRAKGASVDDLKKIVFTIPEEIFEIYHESKVALVFEIASNIDINIADKILVDWFVQNPNKIALPLTQIHTNALTNRSQSSENPYLPNKCMDGITYCDGFETFTKILVRDVDIKHQDLLDIESPLGKRLENAQEGDIVDDITVIQRISPYVAAFRLAANIRSGSYDGTDFFKMHTLPADQSEWLPYFKKVMQRYSSEDNHQGAIFQNLKVPFSIRCDFTDRGNPVKGAISHLTVPSSTPYLGLFNNGEDKPKKVIIDIYTAVYVSILGLSSNFEKLGIDLIICKHTKASIEAWLKDILRDDYLSMGVSENRLYKITANNIKENNLGLINGLQTILEYAKVEILKPVDTPDYLVKIRGMIDETVYSTFQLSYANSIPLLCIDNMMCELLFHVNCPIANIHSFVLSSLNDLSIAEKKRSIELSLLTDTPVPILYNDIMELSQSAVPDDTFLVFKFMETYGDTINTIDNPLFFLRDVVRNVTVHAYLEGSILKGGRTYNPLYNGYAEHVFNYCCRSAMKTIGEGSAEQKFAAFVHSVVDTPKRVQKYVQLISFLASHFASGHFLDINECNKAMASFEKNASM